MTGLIRGRETEQCGWLVECDTQKLWFALLWLMGLVSAFYLFKNALLLAFLSIVFAPAPSSYMTKLDIIQTIAMDSTPACFYAVLGFVGFKLCRPSSRFWVLGLAAVLVETALAIYAFADPGTLPMFTDWLL